METTVSDLRVSTYQYDTRPDHAIVLRHRDRPWLEALVLDEARDSEEAAILYQTALDWIEEDGWRFRLTKKGEMPPEAIESYQDFATRDRAQEAQEAQDDLAALPTFGMF